VPPGRRPGRAPRGPGRRSTPGPRRTPATRRRKRVAAAGDAARGAWRRSRGTRRGRRRRGRGASCARRGGRSGSWRGPRRDCAPRRARAGERQRPRPTDPDATPCAVASRLGSLRPLGLRHDAGPHAVRAGA
jgi:hypothetical protein